jgi:hypothetical protein
MATRRLIGEILNEMRYMANSPINGKTASSLADLYASDLSDIPDDILVMAVRHYRTTETFFPQIGALRQKALELMVDALDIPTATEAWGYVLGAIKNVPAINCETGAALHGAISGKIGNEYWDTLNAYDTHVTGCAFCCASKTIEDYHHRTVTETVRLLGGRAMLLTDNSVADRARFIQAYNEIVEREKKRAIMHGDVRDFVEKTRTKLLDAVAPDAKFAIGEMARLSDGMRRKNGGAK